MHRTTILLFCSMLLLACAKNKLEEKGFSVAPASSGTVGEPTEGLMQDTLNFSTRPRKVLLTQHKSHRLRPIYKVNYNPRDGKPFTGNTAFHHYYHRFGDQEGNRWNNNFMPGFSAAYGYNFVNVAHHHTQKDTTNLFFEMPVLIKTLYYPAFSKDTLNGAAVQRAYHMVSCYDEDTNQDGKISTRDLRRLYYFDLNGQAKRALIPKNYAVMSSEYDPANDYMYVSAQLDENQNGQMEYEEAIHVFWIDLGAPERGGRQY